MKRTGLFALMISLALLGGCAAGGDGGESEFTAWQAALRAAEELSFSACVTADYGGRVFDYAAALSYADGASTLRLTEPAMLEGVTLRSADGGVTLSYDGASLELGSLTANGLSPAAALPLLLDTLQHGRVLSSARTREDDVDYLVLTLASEGGEFTVWLLRDSLSPVRAELSDEGRLALSCDISGWNQGEGQS